MTSVHMRSWKLASDGRSSKTAARFIAHVKNSVSCDTNGSKRSTVSDIA